MHYRFSPEFYSLPLQRVRRRPVLISSPKIQSGKILLKKAFGKRWTPRSYSCCV